MDILQEIYFMWDEKFALIKLNNDKDYKKRNENLENLRKEFFKKIDNVIDSIKKKYGSSSITKASLKNNSRIS